MTTIDTDERAIEYIGDESQALAVVEQHFQQHPLQTYENFTGKITLAADPYVGVSAVPFDEKAQKVLAEHEHVPDEWLDIRPEGKGLIYLSHMKARHVLNAAFGFGGWAIVPSGEFVKEQDGDKVTLYRQYRLYVNGRFVGETVAAGAYYTNNRQQDYSDAAEACQSYAINRLVKNFGVAAQCWDKQYAARWREKYAEQWRNPETGKNEWRKKPAGDVGKPTAADQSSDQTPPVVPQSSSPISNQPATSPAKGNTATIRPVKFDGKSWRLKDSTICMYLIDSDGDKWTLAGQKLLDEAENAIIDGKLLKVVYSTNGKYRNVQSVEIV